MLRIANAEFTHDCVHCWIEVLVTRSLTIPLACRCYVQFFMSDILRSPLSGAVLGIELFETHWAYALSPAEFDHLRGTANGTRWQLRMQRNQSPRPNQSAGRSGGQLEQAGKLAGGRTRHPKRAT